MSSNLVNSYFRLEPTVAGAKITGVHESLLQEGEKDILWYRDNFLGKDHDNYICFDSPKGPIALSLIQDLNGEYKILYRHDQGSERIVIPARNVVNPWYRRIFGLGPSLSDIVDGVIDQSVLKHLTLCKNPELPTELLTNEERQVIRSYKFGLCYLAKGQSTEEEMFANRHENASQQFQQFLSFMGEKIELKGWKGYRAGLDVNDNQTGNHSIYTKWQGYEIMFHVSTMLPFNKSDNQQLERKRHVGNDIVIIVFQDSDTPFQMTSLTSKQNHVVFLITPKGEGYRMQVASKNGVPPFTPELPDPVYFERNAVSRDFLLYKLVNAERACYKAPSFAPKIARTRAILLKSVAEKCGLKPSSQ